MSLLLSHPSSSSEQKGNMMYTMDLLDIEEDEEGNATYTFKVDEESAVFLTELGMKLILHCAVTRVDLQEVFDYILSKMEGEEDE